MPNLIQTFVDADGAPLVGGKVYFYEAGTSTPLATYQDQTELVLNTNPVILDANGQANIWLKNEAYKIVLKDSLENTLVTRDNVTHIATGSILTALLADNSVSTIKIQNSAVTTAKIDNAAVTREKIANDAIDGTKIEDDSIDSEHYVDGSIDNVHLAGGIADDKLAAPRRLQTKIVNSSTNITIPADASWAIIKGAGGGGGGGSGGLRVSGVSLVNNQGGCGGSGSIPIEYLISVTPSQVLTSTIGAGGAGAPQRTNGGSAGAAGSAGGTTTLVGTNIDLKWLGAPGGSGGLIATEGVNNPGNSETWRANGPYSASGAGGEGADAPNTAAFDGEAGGGHSFRATAAVGGAKQGTSIVSNAGGGGGGGGNGFGVGGTGGPGGVTSTGVDAAANSSAGGGGSGAYGKDTGTNDTIEKGGDGGSGRIEITCVTATAFEGTV